MTAGWLLRCAEHGYQPGMESGFIPARPAPSSPPPPAAVTANAEAKAEATDENQPPHPPAGANHPGPKRGQTFRQGGVGGSGDADDADGIPRAVARDLFPSVASLYPGSGDGSQKDKSAIIIRNAEAAAMEAVRADAAAPAPAAEPALVGVGTAAADPASAPPPLAADADVPPGVSELGCDGDGSPRTAAARTSGTVRDAPASTGAGQPDRGGRGGGAGGGSTMTPAGAAPSPSPEPGTSGLEQQLLSMLSGARRNGGAAGGGVGAGNISAGGIGARGRRLRLGAWNARPALVRSSPSLSGSTGGGGGVARTDGVADAAGLDPLSAASAALGSSRGGAAPGGGVDGGAFSATSRLGRVRASSACSSPVAEGGGLLLSGFSSDHNDDDHNDDDHNDDDDDGRCHTKDIGKRPSGGGQEPSRASLRHRCRPEPARSEWGPPGCGDEAPLTHGQEEMQPPANAAVPEPPPSLETTGRRIGGGALRSAIELGNRRDAGMSGGGIKRLRDGRRRDGASAATFGEDETGSPSCAAIAGGDVDGTAPATGLENDRPRQQGSNSEKVRVLYVASV